MADDIEWRPLEDLGFVVSKEQLDNIARRLGYEVTYAESSNAVMLEVGKGTMFCGRPMHHTYWKFHGWLTDDVVKFTEWTREDEMAPGWGGPATAGFGIMLGDEVFDEESHETDWDIAEEQLPYIVEEIKS